MPREVRTVAVLGSGYMGGGIAQVFAAAGFTVQLADQSAEVAAAARDRLVAQSREFEARELFASGAADAVDRHLHAADSVEEAAGQADLIIEAVFEDVDVKSEVLERASAHARPDTIIGTNTSTISVNTLRSAVTAPERFLTIHFFNPAPFVPGAEVVASEDTDEAVVEAVVRVLERAGKRPAVVGDTPGMVVNRIQYAMVSEAFRVVEEGVASMEAIDTLVRNSFGFRLGLVGPFSMVDQAGVDVYAKCFGILRDAFGDRMAPPAALESAVAEGALGMKSGRGLLGEYDEDTRAAIQGYRDHAYVRMQGLQDDLGAPPSAGATQH
ncbi:MULTISPECIES: 3-hydroxyacyl-CoA dehydrogenase family protein [unclassified Brachybacterium]|uniref:3-hydroxyacyl-CoA dehydrogenase family protein n=1 Tax=unclassified Brachybacterium TaxID=2623841 RepID=UPI003623648F